MDLELGQRVGRLLRERKETVSIVEGTTGGLVNASLQAAEKASRYMTAGVSIYSIKGGKGILPLEVRKRLGGVENYKNGEIYHASKVNFAEVMSGFMRTQIGTSWAVAEGGATDATSLPPHMQDFISTGFTIVGVASPSGHIRTFAKRSTHNNRVQNMAEFTSFALEALETCIKEEATNRTAKL